MTDVEIIKTTEYREAAAVLFECFKGDDISKYLFGHIADQNKRDAAERVYYECIVYSHILKGLVTGIRADDGVGFESVAVWSLPHSGDMEDFVTYWRSGFYNLSWKVGKAGRRKIYNELFDMLYRVEEEVLGDSGCYTVVYVATCAKARGKGNLRRLFSHMNTNFIDRDGALTYLECSALGNIPIYEGFGFEPVREISLGADARMHIMVRGAAGARWPQADAVRQRFRYAQAADVDVMAT